jgi:hypothetical protein
MAMTNGIIKGTSQRLVFLLTDATDNETGETGRAGSLTAQISKNGGALATCSNTASEISNGLYYIDLTTTETNTAGPLWLRVTDSGTSNTFVFPYNVVEDPIKQMIDSSGTDIDAWLNEVADHVIKRTFSNAYDSADGDGGASPTDHRSLLGGIARLVNKVSSSGGTMTVTQEDDTTAFWTATVTTSASAEQATSVEPN